MYIDQDTFRRSRYRNLEFSHRILIQRRVPGRPIPVWCVMWRVAQSSRLTVVMENFKCVTSLRSFEPITKIRRYLDLDTSRVVHDGVLYTVDPR